MCSPILGFREENVSLRRGEGVSLTGVRSGALRVIKLGGLA